MNYYTILDESEAAVCAYIKWTSIVKMAYNLKELCRAVSRGEIELVKNLLTTGIDPNRTLSNLYKLHAMKTSWK